MSDFDDEKLGEVPESALYLKALEFADAVAAETATTSAEWMHERVDAIVRIRRGDDDGSQS